MLRNFEQIVSRTQPEGVRSGPGDLDLVIYSLRKWMRLALGGNPTVLMPLFAPEAQVRRVGEPGLRLQANAWRFATRKAGESFLGYMINQRAQLTGERPRKHTNRPELIAKYGFDTKFAYHAVRIGLQGREFLINRTITLPMIDDYRSRLYNVRAGFVSLAEVLQWMTEVEIDLRQAIDLVEDVEPPYDWADQFLGTTYQDQWAKRSG